MYTDTTAVFFMAGLVVIVLLFLIMPFLRMIVGYNPRTKRAVGRRDRYKERGRTRTAGEQPHDWLNHDEEYGPQIETVKGEAVKIYEGEIVEEYQERDFSRQLKSRN